MIGCSIQEIIRENNFEQMIMKPRLKFNPGLALIGLRTTGPRVMYQVGSVVNKLIDDLNVSEYFV